MADKKVTAPKKGYYAFRPVEAEDGEITLQIAAGPFKDSKAALTGLKNGKNEGKFLIGMLSKSVTLEVITTNNATVSSL